MSKPPRDFCRAAFAGQLSCVRSLLAAGAKPSATDSSFLDMKTPLHKAASQGHRDVCIALMEAGADPNACDVSGNTALDVLYLSSSEYLLSPSIPLKLSPESIEKRRGDGTTAAEDDRRVKINRSGDTRYTGGWYGEAVDWNGARDALERFGGGRQRTFCRASVGGSSGGGGDRSKDTRLPAVASAAVIPSEGDIPDFQLRGDHQNYGGVIQKTSKGSKEKEVMPHVRAAGDGNGGAGIPCGECRLSKVVMVRSICCGSLVCKPCMRELSARRKSCRRCRDSD